MAPQIVASTGNTSTRSLMSSLGYLLARIRFSSGSGAANRQSEQPLALLVKLGYSAQACSSSSVMSH